MGGNSSRSQVSPVVVAAWTEEQLSDAIKELGPAYEAYGQACVDHGITGEVLLSTDEAELPEVFQDLGVKTVHKTRLALEVKKLKEDPAGQLEAAASGQQDHHDIFLSLRFGEAMAEAKALRQALAASGESAFICEVAAGEDIKDVVIDKLAGARLVVVLGTATYGTGTVNFSTKEEMEFFLSEGIPFVLVKMCKAFEVTRTRFNFGPSVGYIEWLPGEPMPDGLVSTVLAALTQARKSTDAPSEQVFMARKMSLFYPSAPVTNATPTKRFAGFLSHFKHECGTEARLVQLQLKPIVQANPIVDGGSAEIFLDSDDLSDLRNLLAHVKETQVLVLLQSKGVLTRPWVIIELFTAITHDVPIVALNVKNANPYNYAEAESFLMHFDEEIDIANPGAAQLLIDMGIDPVDVAYRLSDCLPNIISTDFNPNSSENMLQASLVDLACAMRKALPIAPSMPKEEWLEKRKTHKRSAVATAGRKAHGSSEAPASALVTNDIAEIPATVPDLPGAYLVRESDLSQLREALLVIEGSASLTSKEAQKKTKKPQNKVGAHGMGGVGKTTIAAALVHDPQIRSSFEKIVWVSVGQEPDIRDLQSSLHFQFSGAELPDSVKSDRETFKAISDAAKCSKALLVLDDVWDPKHEKPLNCMNLENGSRLFFTTRIRGLLKNAAEVDVGILSQADALKLLQSSAGLDEEDLEDGSEEHDICAEIVELCGRLPLTLAIAGGMVAETGQGFTHDILDIMKEQQELEDEEGMTVESRVISSSQKMMVKSAGKNKDLINKVFPFFAIFPEDVPVPAPFFNKMAPILSDEKSEKKARLAVGSCLGTLLKYNLLKGSLGAGSGVFMHDIVRDYVINLHSEEELRELQKSVVATILDARPEPGGFAMPALAGPATWEGFVARQLYWHVSGSLEESEEPPDAWMRHPDVAIRMNVAGGVGVEKLGALSRAREQAGDKVRAAEASFCAYFHGKASLDVQADHVYNAARLLEEANAGKDGNDADVSFEKAVLKYVFYTEMGSERHKKAMSRWNVVMASTAEATWDTKYMETRQGLVNALKAAGCFGGEGSIEIATPITSTLGALYREAGQLHDHPSVKNTFEKICPSVIFVSFIACAQFEPFSPSSLNLVEEELIEANAFYDYETCSPAIRKVTPMDFFISGCHCVTLGLCFGALDPFREWHRKMLNIFHPMEFASAKKYETQFAVAINIHQVSVMQYLCMLGEFDLLAALLRSVSFNWDSEFDERYDLVFNAANATWKTMDQDSFKMHCRFMIFLSSPEGSIDPDEVNSWIPSPQEVADAHNRCRYMSRIHFADLPGTAALAFLKLGRDEDACEVAKLVLSGPTVDKKWILVTLHSVLGQVAAKRGDFDEADGHFEDAIKEARLSRLPMVELLAARDWKTHLLEPNGRDCGAAEVVIDGACAAMNKSREQLASVLQIS